MDPIQPAMFRLEITADNGVPFCALAIAASAAGPNDARTPADRGYATVEFYDMRFPIDGEHGQFTGGCYDVDTIRDHYAFGSSSGALNLYGGEDDWRIDGRTMQVVRQWLDYLVRRGQLR